MPVDIKWDVDEDTQVSSFQNATLQGFGGGDRCISVAVNLEPPPDLNLKSKPEVRWWLNNVFASVLAEGCTVEVQVSPS